MNRIIFIILLQAVILYTTACKAQNIDKEMMQERKTLVAYFSATGTTAHAAERIAQITDSDLYRIISEQPYTSADLDWNNTHSRSSIEMNNLACRPAIKGSVAKIAEYDLILIGYPIWWDSAPRVINTFIEKHNLKGKTIKVFATSGSSGIEYSLSKLKRTYPELKFEGGLLMNRASNAQIRQWIEK